MELFKPGRVFDFMGQRKFWITLSITLVVISTFLTFWPGPNYGTDFRGGTEVEVAFNKPVDAAQVREMGRDARLAEVQDFLEFGDGKLFFLQQQQNPQAAGIGQETQMAQR